MLLHIGEDTVVLSGEVVAILDLSSALSPDTQRFLKKAQDGGCVRNVGEGGFKSVLVCEGKAGQTVYFSPISASTLVLRSGLLFSGRRKQQP